MGCMGASMDYIYTTECDDIQPDGDRMPDVAHAYLDW